jgi:pantoate--beta-alanine ligase
MEILHTIEAIQNCVGSLKKKGKSIGFVPTMGALHQGHLSLVNYSKASSDYTVVSIFVNPTQFNDKEDLKKYPRNLNADAEMLIKAGVDFLFAPSESEMYPEPDTRIFTFGNLDSIMEGAHRPGHFNGVAQIVSKLFDAVKPTKAFFGEKDFQQLAIIKRMVSQLNYPVQIIPCPIVRESDGLAMSSRNTLLTPVQRLNAVVISQTLIESTHKAGELSIEKLKEWVIIKINDNPELNIEYFEIVDDTYLMPVKSWEEPVVKYGCVAVKVGKIRLIDNIKYNL